MATIDEGDHGAPERRGAATADGLLANSVTVLAIVYFASAMSWYAAAAALPIEHHVPVVAGLVLAAICALVLRALPFHSHPRFGWANLVTSLRAGMISLVCAIVLSSGAFGEQQNENLIWATAATVMLALLLDGVDGYLARRYRQESAFGARFDMELDAFLILVLSVAALVLEKAGPWVLLIGLLRYAFVLAQWPFPWMTISLPVSFRRKLVCVIQVATLCGVLLPIVSQPVSGALCAVALALLVSSFFVDVRYLMARRGETV
ncbi:MULTISPECIES: CDP-alcohol phosphatidyltransferase family protein [unclassified Rhizobium]|uniref:CDP-alcohol phosphatidyltransferase family protein n=1 Tax=unclassified Rhizobium TaxID=2613769 RepID=UPI0009EAA911|nr:MULTISPECIES: CDP-alcohol phosphatidyltransferase family protein [unclassified Rhizobium]